MVRGVSIASKVDVVREATNNKDSRNGGTALDLNFLSQKCGTVESLPLCLELRSWGTMEPIRSCSPAKHMLCLTHEPRGGLLQPWYLIYTAYYCTAAIRHIQLAAEYVGDSMSYVELQ